MACCRLMEKGFFKSKGIWIDSRHGKLFFWFPMSAKGRNECLCLLLTRYRFQPGAAFCVLHAPIEFEFVASHLFVTSQQGREHDFALPQRLEYEFALNSDIKRQLHHCRQYPTLLSLRHGWPSPSVCTHSGHM